MSRVTGLQPLRRVTAVRDTIRILKGLRCEQTLSYEGEMYALLNYRADWATPPPRIYAGATCEQMLRMAAGCADGTVLSDVPLGRMREVMDWVHRGLLAAGRARAAFRINNFMAWHVQPDRAAALAEARRELVWRGFLLPWFSETLLERTSHDRSRRAGGPEDIERIAGRIHALGAAGLDEVALRPHDDPEEGLRLIGERLLPALR